MENDAILRYFLSSYENVMKLKGEGNEVLDYYSTIILIDSIERVFLNGRNGKLFGTPNGFEVFDACCVNDFKGDKKLYEFCKYLRHSKQDVNVKSKCFIGYSIRNNKFVDFIVDLLKNEDIIVDMFDRTAFFRSPSLMSKFMEHLIELEKLNFSKVIDNNGFVIEENNSDIYTSNNFDKEKENNDINLYENISQNINNDVNNSENNSIIINSEENVEKPIIGEDNNNTIEQKKPSSIKKKRKVKNRVIDLD